MKELVLVFPHQLFRTHPSILKGRKVLIIEDMLYFGDKIYPADFHKKKLMFHRASMKGFARFLKEKNIDVDYVDYPKLKRMNTSRYLHKILAGENPGKIYYADPVDFMLEKRLKQAEADLNIKSEVSPSPMFLTDKAWYLDYFAGKNSYFMASFYTEQRKHLDILLDENGRPQGGKWSLDFENRKKLPKNLEIPGFYRPRENEFVIEARKYINENFPRNPGSDVDFFYPVEFDKADNWFNGFLEKRFKNFGKYQDALSVGEPFLFHSLLSPLLNAGLLTPDLVIEKSLSFAEENKIPLNSLEGFIRQIIGWREYIRALYDLEGVKQRNSNFWSLRRKMPASFYSAAAGIDPVDSVIKNVLRNAYAHHIERLMVLGNFMLLCEIRPKDVYKWFMELFIDAYDWVMVPNVYGMSQYADGGLISTKPYISSSNYLLKMSDYKKGEWCPVWDGLYWNFINKHKDILSRNPRMKMMISQLEKMDNKILKKHIDAADDFLKHLK